MPNIEFKISDGQKYDFLFSLLNPNFNEAGGWVIEYAICDVYDEYAIVRNYSEGVFERVYYTKDEENDSLEITNKERCYIVDVNEAEKNALNNIKGESTYVEVEAAMAETAATVASLKDTVSELNNTVATLTETNENLTTENSEYSTKVEELENTISTLSTEKDELQVSFNDVTARMTEIEELNATYSAQLTEMETVKSERDSLATFKKEVEKAQKMAVIEGYVDDLSDEIINEFTNNLDKYTAAELDMHLTYAQKKANPNLFAKQTNPESLLPKDDDCGRGLGDILAKYQK